MRLKTFILCSTAIALATPLQAQTTEPTPAQPTPAPVPPEEPVADDPATPEDEGEEIVVTGIRRSLESAQAIKRESEAILDSIVAEDIGKLPDITASASLARVPGVQVNRGAGEAANVQIRGLPDISTTYNGREIFTAEGRFVAIQDFPAGQVAALEVYKSSTANLIEGGIGGQVNVRGRRPFDFKGFTLFGAVNGVHNEQVQDFMLNTNVLISNRWDTGIGEIGILLSGAYVETEFLDSTREAAQFVGARPNFATPDFRFPDSVGIFYGRGDRWRPSATAAIQWKPTPELEIYADGLYQGFRGRESNSFHLTPLFGPAVFTNVVLEEGTNQVKSFTSNNQVSPRGFLSSENGDTDTYQGAAGFIFDPEGGIRLSGDVAYTDSTFTLQVNNIDYFLGTTPTVDVDFDTDGPEGGPVFNWRDVDSTNPANYFFRGLFDRNFRVRGKDIQGRLDAEYATDWDYLTRFNIGVRFNDRDALFRNGQRFADFSTTQNRPFEAIRIPLSSLPVDLELTEPGFTFDNAQPLNRFVRANRDSIRANADALRALTASLNPGFGPSGPPAFNPLEAFDANEKAYAGYAQAKYEIELGGDLLVDGLLGVRAVRTETTVAGTSRTEAPNPVAGQPNIVTFTPVAETRKDTEFLPNASARVEFGDGLQLRLGYTQTRTRPNFSQLNPSSLVSPIGGDNFVNINSGNPDLEPLRSNNYDASLEYYFSRSGSATFALFRRDVEGFIAGVQVIEPNDPNNPSAGGRRFNRPENGGEGRLEGFEIAFNTTFDFEWLPEWARGFGVQTNYTYNDATSELPGGTPPTVVDLGPPGGTLYPQDLRENLPGQQRLAGVSKHSYNLVAFYERPQFSARVAYNYRSDFVTFYRNPPNFPAVGPDGPCCIEFDRPEIFEGRGVLDFSTTVTPVPQVTIAFDVGNVLGNPIKLTNPYTADPDGPSFPLRRVYLERSYSLGVRFRF